MDLFYRRALPLAAVGLVVLLVLSGGYRLSGGSASTTPPQPGQGEVQVFFLGPGTEALSTDAGATGAIPQQDPCLHCHISGEETNLWAPLARWSVFGTFGLLFAFGVYRSASIWKTRRPWQPLTIRAARWVDSRYQLAEPLAQIRDKPVPAYARRWWYCLGGITAMLFVVQAATGIMLAFYYKPTPEDAYASIQFIENEVYFGSAIRAMHHWAANGMIIMCIAHMVRVFVMGAYKPPRELSWVSGAILLLITLAFGFTGYLLPWDQRAFWATTVGTEIAGSIPVIGDLILVFLRVGWEVGGLTLSRFYALHIIVLPITTLVLMGAHFLMVRRLGIARPL
ncbi:MAG TPA: cytochrome b N-terminal domain-containing protein [Candidatus Sulfomarinibacteraceae bacterium]|nr:cytochrome b N-terminal domain-containing protein [Candidatus Sulfomarinibacteraceae bacterium]